MPGFRRVHVTVAAIVILIVAALLPAVFTWLADLRSVGLVAIALCLFSAVLWLVLLASLWLSVVIGVSLAIGSFALFAEPVGAVLVQFAQGRFEPLAVALSIAGVATIVLGMRRLARLNEDMPWYHGWAAGWSEQSRVAMQAAAEKSSQPGLRQRLEGRRMARLIGHVRQAPVSRWSGISRWQAAVPVGWPLWLISVLATVLMFLVWTWIIRSGVHGPHTSLFMLMAFGFLACVPAGASIGQVVQRTGARRDTNCCCPWNAGCT